jgi:hypothetical protein
MVADHAGHEMNIRRGVALADAVGSWFNRRCGGL